MIKVFARHGSTQKALVAINDKSEVPTVVRNLNDKVGGQWVAVDELRPGETLVFEDSNVYLGFEPGQDRYFERRI